MQKLLIGTGNQTRLEYVKSMLNDLNLDIIGLKEANITQRAHENGTTPLENSLEKAQFYHEISELATLSIDSGLYIDNFSSEQQPGLFVRRIGKNRDDASDGEMLTYYIEQLKKTGGDSTGYWEIGITLIKPNSKPLQTTFRQHTRFTTAPAESMAEGEPLNAIQIDLATGKYLSDLSVEEKSASQAALVAHIHHFVEMSL